MRIYFFYRLEGDKTSYERIKSFIRYLKTIPSKVIYFSQFFPKVGFGLRWKGSRGRDSNSRPNAPKALDQQIATAPMRTKWGYSLLVGMTGMYLSLNIAI